MKENEHSKKKGGRVGKKGEKRKIISKGNDAVTGSKWPNRGSKKVDNKPCVQTWGRRASGGGVGGGRGVVLGFGFRKRQRGTDQKKEFSIETGHFRGGAGGEKAKKHTLLDLA